MSRAIIIFATLFAVLVSSCGQSEGEKKRHVSGYAGRAQIEPFLAARRLLEREGVAAETGRSWLEVDGSASLVFYPLSEIEEAADFAPLIEWVNYGGHLVICVAGCDEERDDWGRRRVHQPDLSAGALAALEQIGISLDQSGNSIVGRTIDLPMDYEPDDLPQHPDIDREILKCQEQWADLTYEISALMRPQLSPWDAQQWDVQATTGGDQYALLSKELGYGRLTVLNDAAPLRNAFIGEAQNAHLLSRLHWLGGGGDVLFLYGDELTFLNMLYRYGWLGLLLLLVGTALWIWRGLIRFGPVRRATSDGRTLDYQDHVRHTGAFLWKHRQSEVLLNALRQDVLQTVTRDADGAPDIPAIAARCDLPEDRVRRAFDRNTRHDASAFLQTVRTLRQIQKRL